MDVAILDEFRGLWGASGGSDIRLRSGFLSGKTQIVVQPGDSLVYVAYANEGYYLASADPELGQRLKDLAAEAGASLSAIQRLKFGTDYFSSPASIWFHVLFQLNQSDAHEKYREIRDPVRASVVAAERLLVSVVAAERLFNSQEPRPVAAPTSSHPGTVSKPVAALTSSNCDMASTADLATEWHTDPEATRKVLNRWRKKHGHGWVENTERKSRDARFLYDRNAVRQTMEALSIASSFATHRGPASESR